MWIGVENKQMLLDKVVESLSDPDAGTSYTLTVPPGFGESYVPAEIARRLRREAESKIAHVEVDMLGGNYSFVQAVYQQWGGAGESPRLMGEVLARLAGKNELKVIVISRFHKFLEVVDEELLRALREAEQASQIKTVVVSIYPLKWIESEWKKQGHKLLASGFGDMHSPRCAQPIDISEFFQQFSNYRNTRVPPTLMKRALAWTGGVPQHFTDVLDLWIECGRPDGKYLNHVPLQQLTKDRADSIAKYLDSNGSLYRDLIVDIHTRRFAENAMRRFHVHPWADLLLDESGLRSDSLGEQCLHRRMKQAVEESSGNDPHSAQLELATKAYESGQFDLANDCLLNCPESVCTGSVRLLRHHSRIMDALLSRGVDAEWRSLTDALNSADQDLENFELTENDVRRLRSRYSELRELSETVTASLGRGSSTRVVDQLSHGESKAQRAAMAILGLQFEDAKSSRGNSESIAKAISMPEQLLRVWARWHLKIDYSKVPESHSEVWTTAKGKWRQIRGDELIVPEPGQKFPGFAVFAFFCVAKQSLEGVAEVPLIHGFDELRAIQFAFDMRNAPAHATTVFDGKSRRKYLKLIERWLVRLCEGYRGEKTRYEEVLSRVAPLPLIRNSRLFWAPRQ